MPFSKRCSTVIRMSENIFNAQSRCIAWRIRSPGTWISSPTVRPVFAMIASLSVPVPLLFASTEIPRILRVSTPVP